MKNPATTAERRGYYKDRNEKIVSFVVDDVELKRRIQAAADKDGRSVNGWITHHILPTIEQVADAQLSGKGNRGR